MPSENVRYWFSAKRYGWGWGLPITWEGWIVLLGFIGLVAFGAVILPPRPSPIGFLAYIGVLSVLLIAICWWKGEPPKWRWGGE
jgi:hypothetical protein